MLANLLIKIKGYSAIDLQSTSQFVRLLADPTRVRLLALLEHEELTVAELAAVTRLAQPRVSTHLSRLREANLVRIRRSGVSSYYSFNDQGIGRERAKVWDGLKAATDDPQIRQDRARLPEVLHGRANGQNWADTVAGDMERHYSPGRTWEATARGVVHLLRLGDVLDVASGDGVTADLLAARARSMICLDASPKVVEACAGRLAKHDNVRVQQGDMHCLPYKDGSFDQVLLFHALTYTDTPEQVMRECARVLRRGGELLAVTLRRHRFASAVAPFGHRNLGFEPDELAADCRESGLAVHSCQVTSREIRLPNFEVITLHGQRPETDEHSSYA